ncbi:MAG: metallophosphoesterase [Methanoregulaceae archaeon]|nr:metallophosphoesterase [Methanoregulaceae archaeon]
MRIGILGDTHDHIPNLKKAVTLLNREAGQLFLHTGDFISPFVIPVLSTLDGEVKGVYGNNDGDHDLLQERCRETRNVSISGNFFEMHYEGVRIALLHGHEKALLADLIESRLFDLVVHGHSHRPFIEKNGDTLVINPGEVCGYLTEAPTCAVYDIMKGQGSILRI